MFEVRNDNNKLVLNADYRNLVLKRKIPLSSILTMNPEWDFKSSRNPIFDRLGAKASFSLKADEKIFAVGGKLFKERHSVGYKYKTSVGQGEPDEVDLTKSPYQPYFRHTLPEVDFYRQGNQNLFSTDHINVYRKDGILYYMSLLGENVQPYPMPVSDIFIYTFGDDDGSGTNATSGLQIFDEKGRPVYDSNKKYLNILEYGPCDAANFNFLGKTVIFTRDVDPDKDAFAVVGNGFSYPGDVSKYIWSANYDSGSAFGEMSEYLPGHTADDLDATCWMRGTGMYMWTYRGSVNAYLPYNTSTFLIDVTGF